MSTQYLIILSILGWGVGSLFYKIANDNMHPVMVSILVTVFYIILAPLEYVVFKPSTNMNATGVSFALMGAALMGIGSLTYFFALQRGGEVGGTTALTSVYPALTMLLSVLFLKEELTVKKVIGVAMAFGAVYILSRK